MELTKRISKPTIIITSLGRTGTKFFQVLLENVMPDSTALHEPDVLNIFEYQGLMNRLNQINEQVKESGFVNLFLRKPLGLWSIISISDKRMRGELDSDTAINLLINQRKKFITAQKGSVYIESNIGYYGILDLLDEVFEQYRAVFIVRDGRDWVRSHMNWGQMYGKGFIQSLYAHLWPTAVEFNLMEAGGWQELSRFEKLCWSWGTLNRLAIDKINNDPFTRLVLFEDIFLQQDRYHKLQSTLSFLSSINERLEIKKDTLSGWLDKRIHESCDSFPTWSEWSGSQKSYFLRVCGSLMDDLGYDID